MESLTRRNSLTSESKNGVTTLTTRRIEELVQLVNADSYSHGPPLKLGEKMSKIPLDQKSRQAYKRWSKVRNEYMHKVIDDYDEEEFINDFLIVEKTLVNMINPESDKDLGFKIVLGLILFFVLNYLTNGWPWAIVSWIFGVIISLITWVFEAVF